MCFPVIGCEAFGVAHSGFCQVTTRPRMIDIECIDSPVGLGELAICGNKLRIACHGFVQQIARLKEEGF